MKPQRYYWILIAVAAGLTLAAIGGYYWYWQRLQVRANEVRQQMVTSALADEQLEQIDELRQDYNQVAGLKARLDEALPHEKRQSQLVLKLEQLAKSAGMSIPGAGFAPSGTPTTVVAGVQAMPISFELSGSYEQLQAFLKGLERLDRYTSVTSIAITRVEDQAKQLKFSLNINAFLKP